MKLSELLKLKSGTDVRGIAVGDISPVTLTDEAIVLIAKAFYMWLVKNGSQKKLQIAVGNDSRISANHIKELVCNSLRECGSDIIYTGLSSTPSMFMLLQKPEWSCDASIMITASHLPYDRNGLKFFTPEGGLDSKDIDDILHIAAEGNFAFGEGKLTEKSFMDEYSDLLVKTVENACGKRPLSGKKVIVDAGGGAGGFFAEKVLVPLGADTKGSILLEPDGYFTGHIPNPEDKKAINTLAAAVTESKADLGIIFDTDVDRAACVDSDGEEINRNALIALISAILLHEQPNGVIVTDSVTSDGLTKFIESLGGKHLRYKRGYRNVIDKSKELNAGGIYSPLAIETSGHAAFKENYFLDDGAYLITKILICLAHQSKQGKTIGDIISSLERPVEADEIRLGFTEKSADFKSEGKKIIEDLTAFADASPSLSLAANNYEGVRINFKEGEGDGWLLLRQSVHDPVIPINFESNAEGGNKLMAGFILKFLEKYDFIDVQNLEKFLNN